MITSIHALMYADDAVAAREFLRDVVGWPSVDTGDGWLIFGTGPSELGVHPTSGDGSSTTAHHEITLMCDDIEATVADLTSRGAVFARGIRNDGFGLTAMVQVPGAGELMIYQPTHQTAYELASTGR